jgi:uncharacterized protein
MIRVVIDTNIVVSAFIGRAKNFERAFAYQLLLAIEAGQLVPLTSVEALEELEAVLNYPRITKRHRMSAEAIAQAVDKYAQACEFVSGQVVLTGVSPDPDDDKFLTIAVEGRASYLITGDGRHLLNLKNYQGIKIVTVREFMEQSE